MIHAQPERAAWSRRSATGIDARDATTPRKALTLANALRFIGAALVLLALTACGGGVVPGGGPVSTEAPNEPPAVVPVKCPDEMVQFVETLQDLDSRLDVGLNQAAYSERVGDARVAYDRIDIEELDGGCVEQVGIPAENAMNAYIRANNIWNDCITDIDCSNDSITPDLQAEWADASQLVDEALDGLDQ